MSENIILLLGRKNKNEEKLTFTFEYLEEITKSLNNKLNITINNNSSQIQNDYSFHKQLAQVFYLFIHLLLSSF